MSGKPHTSCKKGKRVIVTLKDGTRILDKFVEKKSKGIVLEEAGFINGQDIRAFSIYRGQTKI